MPADSTTTAQQDPKHPSSEELAMERTRLAHERTMMAWIRTSASLISFGFGIYKFFDYFPADRPIRQGFFTPRRFAISLISGGLLTLIGAAGQHWWELGALRRAGGRIPVSLAGIIAALMAIIGLFALGSAITRE